MTANCAGEPLPRDTLSDLARLISSMTDPHHRICTTLVEGIILKQVAGNISSGFIFSRRMAVDSTVYVHQSRYESRLPLQIEAPADDIARFPQVGEKSKTVKLIETSEAESRYH